MAYLTNEKSIHDGHPVELYKFTGPTSALSYYYTNYEANISFGGNTYLSRPLMRSSIASALLTDSDELSIDMPISLTLVQEYAFKTPPRSLDLTIYRYHLGDEANWVTYWTGYVTGFKVVDRNATARAVTVMEKVTKLEVPNAYYQALCNHRLYDDRCGITAGGTYVVATTVASFDGDEITLNSDGGKADGYFNGGFVKRDTDSEKRLIVDHTGDVLTLSYAFRSLSVSDAVTVYAGCDHTVETCLSKFSNVANFGGFPYIPKKNPFESGTNGV